MTEEQQPKKECTYQDYFIFVALFAVADRELGNTLGTRLQCTIQHNPRRR